MPRQVSIGSFPRARMATPFQLFWPCQIAPYPAFSISWIGKRIVRRFQFLKTNDIGLRSLQPSHENGQTAVHAIDVETGDLQLGKPDFMERPSRLLLHKPGVGFGQAFIMVSAE